MVLSLVSYGWGHAHVPTGDLDLPAPELHVQVGNECLEGDIHANRTLRALQIANQLNSLDALTWGVVYRCINGL